jgi:hypothetical protein
MAAEMKVTALLIVALLTGCVSEAEKQAGAWREAPYEYVCTGVQMARVQRETLFCKENTGFYPSYCYGSAIMRNCTHRDRTPPYKDPRND